jgi:hypothetical protein
MSGNAANTTYMNTYKAFVKCRAYIRHYNCHRGDCKEGKEREIFKQLTKIPLFT